MTLRDKRDKGKARAGSHELELELDQEVVEPRLTRKRARDSLPEVSEVEQLEAEYDETMASTSSETDHPRGARGEGGISSRERKSAWLTAPLPGSAVAFRTRKRDGSLLDRAKRTGFGSGHSGRRILRRNSRVLYEEPEAEEEDFEGTPAPSINPAGPPHRRLKRRRSPQKRATTRPSRPLARTPGDALSQVSHELRSGKVVRLSLDNSVAGEWESEDGDDEEGEIFVPSLSGCPQRTNSDLLPFLPKRNR